jgi:hypothetical protein
VARDEPVLREVHEGDTEGRVQQQLGLFRQTEHKPMPLFRNAQWTE